MDKNSVIVNLVRCVLKDEHGVSEETYAAIVDCLNIHGLYDENTFVCNHTDCVDGRYFFPQDIIDAGILEH